MTTSSLPVPSFDELRPVVLNSADQFILRLHESKTSYAGYPLGMVALGLAETEGTELAHDFADDAISTLGLKPAAAFDAWNLLYKNGDEAALPLARRAVGLASENLAFVEAIGVMELGGLHSAERLVSLVTSGDTATTDLARDMLKGVPALEKAALYADLYQTGDTASFELAIDAAAEAKRYVEITGDKHYYRTERALQEMAIHAIKTGDTEDALQLIDHLESAENKASLHVELYKNGRSESLDYVTDFIDHANDPWKTKSVVSALAESGYQPAIKAVQKRVPRFGVDIRNLDDLVTLHRTGDTRAAAKIAKVVFEDDHPEFYTHELTMVGLSTEAVAVAKQAYMEDPSDSNERILLDVEFDVDRWQSVFDKMLTQTSDGWSAASRFLDLARFAKQQKPE